MMEEKIQIESYSYCRWYDGNPFLPKCPYLNKNDDHCNRYNKKLKTYEATDSVTCRDTYCVERCEECKGNK